MNAMLAALLMLLVSMSATEDPIAPPELRWLKENCVELGKLEYSKVSKSKSSVRALVASCGEDRKRQAAMASQFIDLISEKKKFQLYDYYLLWLDGGLLDTALPADKRKLIDALIEKIDHRDEVDTAGELVEELCQFSIEHLQSLTGYKENMMRENPKAKGMFIIDFEKWPEMKEWLKKQRPASNDKP